jgi:hypothetical protein
MYKKYIKYKIKYAKLKKLYGGGPMSQFLKRTDQIVIKYINNIKDSLMYIKIEDVHNPWCLYEALANSLNDGRTWQDIFHAIQKKYKELIECYDNKYDIWGMNIFSILGLESKEEQLKYVDSLTYGSTDELLLFSILEDRKIFEHKLIRYQDQDQNKINLIIGKYNSSNDEDDSRALHILFTYLSENMGHWDSLRRIDSNLYTPSSTEDYQLVIM